MAWISDEQRHMTEGEFTRFVRHNLPTTITSQTVISLLRLAPSSMQTGSLSGIVEAALKKVEE